jgi:hypothetical protein
VDAAADGDGTDVEHDVEDAPEAAGALVQAALADPGLAPVAAKVVEQAELRKGAAHWLSDQATCSVVTVMRVVHEPMRAMIGNILHIASDKWELSQLRRAAQGLARDYRVVLAHNGSITEPALIALTQRLFEENVWGAMRGQDQNIKMKSLAFRMLSRAGGATYQLIDIRHRGFPFKLFGLLDSSEVSSEMRDASSCTLDPFSTRFLQDNENREPGWAGRGLAAPRCSCYV